MMSRSARSLWLVGLAGALLAACAPDPGSQPCGTGGICPPGFQCAAADDVCIPVTVACGNAKLDDPEECDDGNINNGDGCSNDCKNEVCGNGIVDVGEKCDDGNVVSGDNCSETCDSLEICNNNIVDRAKGEVCDDGNNNDGDGCSQNCKSTESCGNGIKDETVGEVCDDGNTMDGDGCNGTCRSGEGCRNGILDPGEECDDGNDVNNDACRSNCEIPRCGDGIVTLVDDSQRYHEQCDGGAAPVDPRQPSTSVPVPVETAECNLDCTLRECGDGKVNHAAGEECDVGAANSDSGACLSTCLLARCGDGHQKTGGPGLNEECDDGNPSEEDDCLTSCRLNTCGDGFQDNQQPVREGCDDGNRVNGDACTNVCISATCGDGIVGPEEECDLGAANSDSGACLANCQLAICGDGHLKSTGDGLNEECDDGNPSNDDNCLVTCKLNTCGDSFRDDELPVREGCDDGNRVDGDACTNACVSATCGDGIVGPGEECDLGAANSNSGACLANCHLSTCGDGHQKTTGAGLNEQCDDGNSDNLDDCLNSCRSNTCGDGFRDDQLPAREGCDDGNRVDGDACTNACVAATCGDGIIGPGEECDLGAANSDSGACLMSCQLAECGDGHHKTSGPGLNEECDDGNPSNGDDCLVTCELNTCGDGFRDAQLPLSEACDDGNRIDGDTCTNSCASARCGDGVVGPGEECDLGAANTDSGACLLSCHLAACGDGHHKTSGFGGIEGCDDGNTDPDDGCSATCAIETCGNGVLDPDEECDLGSANSPTGACLPESCTLARCGDGEVREGVEACDDGGTAAGDGCSPICAAEACGNGILDPEEECDLGAANSPSGACLPESCELARCGDGEVRAEVEECDDGNTDPDDGCSAACAIERCGNGVVDAGEVCDDGNALACGLCNATCTAIIGAPAHGLIVITATGQQLLDGQLDGNGTISIADGFGGAVTFELLEDVEGSVGQPGNIEVRFSAADSAETVSLQLLQAINGTGDELQVSATPTLIGPFLQLVSDRPGVSGNQLLVENVDASGFSVFGMTGGAGGDCAGGDGCTVEDVCQSQSCDEVSHTCDGGGVAEAHRPRHPAKQTHLPRRDSTVIALHPLWVGPVLRGN
jgi:cysteine-rich repeat protein